MQHLRKQYKRIWCKGSNNSIDQHSIYIYIFIFMGLHRYTDILLLYYHKQQDRSTKVEQTCPQDAALKEALQGESAGRLREADENLRRYQELRDLVS